MGFQVILNIITPLLVGLAITYLYKSGNKKIDAIQNGVYCLRMNKFFYYFGIIVFILGIVTVFLPLTTIDNGNDEVIFFSIMSLLFILAGTVLIKIYKTHRLYYTEHELTVISYYGNVRKTQLDQIKSVKFDSLNGSINVDLLNGEVLKISQFIVGLKSLVQHVELQKQLDLSKVKRQINPFRKSKK